nr:metallophosphoesterase family protein [uncultured Cohaesibacter sp.]
MSSGIMQSATNLMQGTGGRPRWVLDVQPEDVYAIGDIHGCLDLLLLLEEQIFAEVEERASPALIVYVGDLVDRGPDSKGVIDHCLHAPLPQNVERLVLCGNHDLTYSEFLMQPSLSSPWIGWGGLATLASYGIDLEDFRRTGLPESALFRWLAERIPAEHMAFIAGLPAALTMPKAHIVHAGLRHDTPMQEQTVRDLMWSRDQFLVEEPASDRLIIHGHTPFNKPEIGPGRIGIDTGAVYGNALTAIHLRGESYRFLEVPAAKD